MTEIDRLSRTLAARLAAPAPAEIAQFVSDMLGDCCPIGVLFYGSAMRQADPDALLDFYVIVERMHDWPWRQKLISQAGSILPPNVIYRRGCVGGRAMRAKVAIMTIAQFESRVQRRSLDTTIWARFSQLSQLVWVQSPAAADRILHAIRDATLTAAWWAACLAERNMSPLQYWENLYAATYGTELRPESSRRPKDILSGREAELTEILTEAWSQLGINFTKQYDGRLNVHIPKHVRRRVRSRWQRMTASGGWLNAARLVKAAFTFENGAHYLADKIERHSGFDVRLSAFEAKHPLLCLPKLLWRTRSIVFRR